MTITEVPLRAPAPGAAARGVVPIILALALSIAAPASAPAQRSQAMRSDCGLAEPNTPASRRRAEQWVKEKLKAFLPSPEEALRMTRLQEEVQQVQLAFSTSARPASGTARARRPGTRPTSP